MPFHWHMEYELLYLLSGEFTLSVDGRSSLLRAGDTAIIAGGSVHGGTPSNCIYECLVFDLTPFLSCSPALFHQKYCDFGGANIRIQPFYTGEDACCQIIRRLFAAMEAKKSGYEFLTIGLIWQLFGQIVKDHTYAVSNPSGKGMFSHSGQMKSILNYIRKNYASPLTLSDLSSVVGLSPEHFCRLFHAVTGRSPIDYLNYYRIECACELLCTTYRSITEIAFSCGFNDLSYFNRLFRKYKNTTPGKYRRLYLS